MKQPGGFTVFRGGWGSESMARLAAAVVATGQQLPTSNTTTEGACLTTGEGALGVAPQASCGHWGLTWRAVCQKALLAHPPRHLLCNLQKGNGNSLRRSLGHATDTTSSPVLPMKVIQSLGCQTFECTTRTACV